MYASDVRSMWSFNGVTLSFHDRRKFVPEVVLQDNAPDFLKVSYKSSCLRGSSSRGLSNACDGIKVGDEIEFQVTVELEQCPGDGVQGGPEHGVPNIPPFYGKHCECLGSQLEQHTALCRSDNSSAELCSHRGDCVCGECKCYDPPGVPGGRVFGQWCECDTFSCERDSEGRVCGGPERGVCCGGETAAACARATGSAFADAACATPTPGDASPGPFCQDCAACVGRCSEFRSCVQCVVFQSGEMSEEECRLNCSSLNIQPVDVAEATDPEERKCIFKDDDSCSFSFVYSYDEQNELVIRAQTTKDCGREALTWYIVGGLVGGIVLVGLLVVCIARFLVYLRDRVEYEKFDKEIKNTQWGTDTNPIFKNAVSNFQNPTYESGQRAVVS
ncbi:hypothetical protein MRX96_023193 [Rhipicephalus microplus]